MKFNRITVDPEVCSGKPCIRGLRFPLSRILGLLSAGETKESILKAYPYLEPEDIDKALGYAACLAGKDLFKGIDEGIDDLKAGRCKLWRSVRKNVRSYTVRQGFRMRISEPYL